MCKSPQAKSFSHQKVLFLSVPSYSGLHFTCIIYHVWPRSLTKRGYGATRRPENQKIRSQRFLHISWGKLSQKRSRCFIRIFPSVQNAKDVFQFIGQFQAICKPQSKLHLRSRAVLFGNKFVQRFRVIMKFRRVVFRLRAVRAIHDIPCRAHRIFIVILVSIISAFLRGCRPRSRGGQRCWRTYKTQTK